MTPKPTSKANAQQSKVSKNSADLWWITLSAVNVLIFLLSAIAIFIKTESSTVRVPVRLVAGNEFVQGESWIPLLNIALQLGLLGVFFFYSRKLSSLDPIYKNGILVIALCVQLVMFAVFFRVAGLTSLT